MVRKAVTFAVRPREVVIAMVVIIVVVAITVGLSLWLRPQHPGAVELSAPSGDGPFSYAGLFPAEDDEPLANPLGITYDDKYLYVAESDAGAIRVFDTDGGRVGTIGLPVGEGQRSAYPSSITAAGGRLAVVDNAANRVLLMDAGSTDRPTGLVVLGDESAPLLRPTAVKFFEDELYVADAEDATVKVYAPDGSYLRTIAMVDVRGETAIADLTVGDGVIYVAGSTSGVIHAVDLESGEWAGDGLGQYPLARTIEPVGDGLFGVVDGLERAVIFVDADAVERGAISAESVTTISLASPRGAAWVARDGRLYVTDAAAGRVFVLNVLVDRF